MGEIALLYAWSEAKSDTTRLPPELCLLHKIQDIAISSGKYNYTGLTLIKK
jgi:hypothetical protein